MRVKQPLFYRQTGVREKAQLSRPRLIPQRKLVLPLESIIHFLPEDTVTLGPSPQDPMFTDLGGRVFIEHVSQLHTSEGGPRRTVLNPSVLMNDYRRKNRLFKPLRKDTALTINPRNTLVVNYAMIGALYRYIPSFKAQYFKWKNISNTFWDNVAKTHERFGWNQYIELVVPETLPTYEQFKRFESGINQKILETFNNQATLNLADLWFWLGDDRSKSTLAVLPDSAFEKINFFVRVKGYFFVLNLGVINEWRKDKEVENDTGLQASALQRRFLALLHGVRDLLSGLTNVEEDTEETSEQVTVSDKEAARAKPAAAANAEAKELPQTKEEKTEAPSQTGNARLVLPEIKETVLPAPTSAVDAPVIEVPKVSEMQPVVAPSDENPRFRLAVADNPQLTSEEAPATVTEDLTKAIADKAWEMHELGLMSAKAYQRVISDSQTYLELKDPFGSGKSMEEMLTVSPEELILPDEAKFPERKTIPDKSMLSSKLRDMQTKYIRNVLNKDVVSSVLAVQHMGVAVKDYKVETVHDTMNHFQIHSVTLKPIRGRQSTIKFRLPVVDDDGRFVSNGVNYKMRLQRADIPIRKVNPSRVALTSYYNKTFVDRSSRRTNDYERWLTSAITERGINPEDSSINELKFGDVFDMQLDLPRVYTLMAKKFIRFNSGGIRFFFDYTKRGDYFAVDLNKVEQGGQVLVGMMGNDPILVDSNNVFYRVGENTTEVLGVITDILGIDTNNAPIEIAEMSVSNKTLPVGFVLAYHLGLSELIAELGCEVNRFRRGERRVTQADEYTLTFQDEVLVFSRLDQRSSMIIAGLDRFKRTLVSYSVWDFDRKDVYYRLIEEMSLGVRYLREIEALFAAWVDPITRGILEEMGEPTTFKGLLGRSVELLLNDQSPEEVDGKYMRYRGYERIAGMVYGEIARSAKLFNARVSTGENAVDMNPLTIWQRVVQDPSVSIVEESNPIQDLREQEVMTYRGDGGRGGKSMVERTRIFHESDMGVVSESTVDSGDVGVVAYLSPDANFTNLRGMTRLYDHTKDGTSKLLSTSALLAPAVAHDDAKRINFVAIQQAQGIFAKGYKPAPLRTGYEQVLAQRNTSLFASSAEEEGVVTEVSDKVIAIKYKSGVEKRFEIGTRYGTAVGVVYPHILTTDFKKGDTFKQGDIIAYNSRYYTPDMFNPGQVTLKTGILCRTALIDNIDTLEDGSVISQSVASQLETQTCEIKTIEVRFDQSIQGLVKVGDHVDLETILCTIEDPETADNPLFDEAALDTLKRISSMTPRAKVVGKIAKIECFYHGDFEDLSPNLQTLALESDKRRRKAARQLGQPVFTGQVDTSFRVRGKALDPDTMAIQVYIEHDVAAGVGDKGVFGNQMKTVFSRVMSGRNETKSGQPIDAIFGRTSIEERIVLSPMLIGTTNTLLRVLSKHVANVYRGKADVKSKV